MKDIKFHICFYTEGLFFTGAPLATQSLGGSESALWSMAHALAVRGHKVDVFCKCPAPGDYAGISYWDVSSFQTIAMAREWDVCIVSRAYPVLALPLRTKMNWLWLHDMPTNSQTMASQLWQTDQMMTLSDFHRTAYLKEYPLFERIMWQTRNGIDISLIERSQVAKRNMKRLIYASRPERGLDVLLLKVWPELQKRDPELELHICGYDMGSWQFAPQMEQFYTQIEQIIKQSTGVTNHGALKKNEFYALLGSAALLVYPTGFPEISCIVALESMAAGTPIVTSDAFALKETVPYEKVEGTPTRESYVEDFVDLTMKLLQDDMLYRRLQKQGRQHVAGYAWVAIAKEWETRMFELFAQRMAEQGPRIAETLLFNSDVVAANKFAIDIGHAPVIAEAVEHLEQHHTNPDTYFDHSTPDSEWTHLNSRFKHIIDMLPPAQTGKTLQVVDLGCGSGALLGHIVGARPDVNNGAGIDFSEKLIDYAKMKAGIEGLSQLHFIREDPTSNVAPVGYADIVIAAEILEHTIDYRKLISAAEAICKPGGTILLTVPSGPWEACSYAQYDVGKLERYHVHHFEQRDLEEIFGAKKNKVISYATGGRSPWGDQLGWWFIRYENDPKKETGEINYERKILTTRPRPTVAACLIVKNEESNLRRAIQSFLPYVDELWIWDAQSTDRSREIAASFAGKYLPKVFLCEQTLDPDGDGLGNFAYWRNESKSGTLADWIYWQDADEELIGGQNLRKYLTGPFYENFIVRQNHIQVRPLHMIEPDMPNRIFRNRPEYNFWGIIHEQPLADLNEEIQPGLRLEDVDIAHYGYMTAQITRYKCVERNLPLLIKDRKLNPSRDVGKLLVQRDYMNLGQIEVDAHRQITDRAVEYLRASVLIYLEHYSKPEDRYHHQAYIYYQLVAKFMGLNGVPVKPEWGVPFEIRTGLQLGLGGITEPPFTPEMRWFVSIEEFRAFMHYKGREASEAILKAQGLPVETERLANGAIFEIGPEDRVGNYNVITAA